MHALPSMLQAISHEVHLFEVWPRHRVFDVVGAGTAGPGLFHVAQQVHQLVQVGPPTFLDFVHQNKKKTQIEVGTFR